jgi:hypothetical protein
MPVARTCRLERRGNGLYGLYGMVPSTDFRQAVARSTLLASSEGEGVAMKNERIDDRRAVLDLLLKKQAQVLELRTLGAATETELLEYELRQETIHELCNQLAHSAAA